MDFVYNSFKIRYVLLNKLFREQHFDNIQSISLYINLESVLNPLHQNSYEEYLSSCTQDAIQEEYISVIANIINIAAHYRSYFTREHVFSNIVYYYTDFTDQSKYNNSVHVPKYRRNYCDMYKDKKYERINEILGGAIEYCHKIVDFLDSVYILKSDRIDGSVIPYLCQDDKRLKADLNLVLSKDVYDWQYVNHGCMLLIPKGDDSVLINHSTFMKYLLYKNDMMDKYKIVIDPELYPFILSVMGNKKRNLPKVHGIGFKRLYKELENLYIKDYISDENEYCYNIEYLNDLIRSNNGFYDTGVKELISSNYYAIDLDRQLNIADPNDNDKILSGIINRYDTNGLKKLNDHTFSDNPINLVELNNYYPNLLEGVK